MPEKQGDLCEKRRKKQVELKILKGEVDPSNKS